MLGTLTDRQKVDWKAYVPTLTHAYNAATHASTGYAPFYLMFGRYPRLSVDAFLGLWVNSSGNNTRADFVDKLKSRLTFAYKAATKEAAKNARRQKTAYDQRVRGAVVETGDRVLVRSVGLKGPQKLANKWEDQTSQAFLFMWYRKRALRQNQELCIEICSCRLTVSPFWKQKYH